MVPVDLCDELAFEPSPQSPSSATIAELCEPTTWWSARCARSGASPAFAARAAQSAFRRAPAWAAARATRRPCYWLRSAAFSGPAPQVDYLRPRDRLGSDVPFFLVQTAALVEGTGERVTALGRVPPWHAVVVKPPVSVSHRWAYARIDAARANVAAAQTIASALRMGEALQRARLRRGPFAAAERLSRRIASATSEISSARRRCALDGSGRASRMLDGFGIVRLRTRSRPRTSATQSLASATAVPESYRVLRCAFWNGEAWRSAA